MSIKLHPDQLDSTRKFTFFGAEFQGEKATGVGTPTVGTDGANKNYVDSVAAALHWKQSARVRTIGNIADLAAGAPLVVDGETLVAGDRVVVPDQTDPIENGVYAVDDPGTGADGQWSRATDFDEDAEVESGATVNVTEGTIYSGRRYTVITPDPIVVDTDPITWAQTGATNDSVPAIVAADPTVTDDIDLGYLIGQLWINSVSGAQFICRDNANGAAVWQLFYFNALKVSSVGAAATYATIAAAMAAAASGDTVYLRPGARYVESFTHTVGVRLVGNGATIAGAAATGARITKSGAGSAWIEGLDIVQPTDATASVLVSGTGTTEVRRVRTIGAAGYGVSCSAGTTDLQDCDLAGDYALRISANGATVYGDNLSLNGTTYDIRVELGLTTAILRVRRSRMTKSKVSLPAAYSVLLTNRIEGEDIGSSPVGQAFTLPGFQFYDETYVSPALNVLAPLHLINASGGPVGMSLPAISTVAVGQRYIIQLIDSAPTFGLLVTPNGAETIGGAATVLLERTGEVIEITRGTSSTSWQVVRRAWPAGQVGPISTVALGTAATTTVYTNTSGGDQSVDRVEIILPSSGVVSNGDLEINIGSNAPDYDNLFAGELPGTLLDNQILTYRPVSQVRLADAGTVRVNVVTPDSGGAISARVVVYTTAVNHA